MQFEHRIGNIQLCKHIKYNNINNILMRLTIENKSKQETFVAIFQQMKNWSSHINMHFENEKLYIQSMDKSHICLANIEIKGSTIRIAHIWPRFEYYL